MKKAINYIIVITVFLLCFACFGESKLSMRTWSSQSGKEIEAVFVRWQGTSIILKKGDGKIVKVPFANFCQKDRDYIVKNHKKKIDKKEEAALLCRPGETSEEIKCLYKPAWSYFLYYPKSFKPEDKWPVIYIMSPNGGDESTLKRYIEGAEQNNWILAVSVQSRNGFSWYLEAVYAMMNDVNMRIPIDRKRMYVSGFSGGARAAFKAAVDKRSFAGVLACGAGGESQNLPERTVVYELSGTNCFNRMDMVRTYKRGKNEYSRLRFFIGQHNWAGRSHLADAMLYLDGCYFLEVGGDSFRIQRLKRAYVGRVFNEIEKDKKANPERAYEWAVFLSKFPMSPKRKEAVKGCLKELLEIPRVKLYKEGLRDMRKFITKYYIVRPEEYRKRDGSDRIKKITAKLHEKYKTTSLGEIFRLLGEPVPL